MSKTTCICEDPKAVFDDLFNCEDLHLELTKHTFLECDACGEPVCLLVFNQEDVR